MKYQTWMFYVTTNFGYVRVFDNFSEVLDYLIENNIQQEK